MGPLGPSADDPKCSPDAGDASPRTARIARPHGNGASWSGIFPAHWGNVGSRLGIDAARNSKFAVRKGKFPSRRGKFSPARGINALPTGKFPLPQGTFALGQGCRAWRRAPLQSDQPVASAKAPTVVLACARGRGESHDAKRLQATRRCLLIQRMTRLEADVGHLRSPQPNTACAADRRLANQRTSVRDPRPCWYTSKDAIRAKQVA